MNTVTILLPTQVGVLVTSEARTRGVDAATLCSGIISEHFLSQRSNTRIRKASEAPAASESTEEGALVKQQQSASGFDVRRHFPSCPGLSVQLAQKFVDAALRLPGTRAFAAGRGVGFEPNFVYITYLRRRSPGGIGVSFYGAPEKHLCGDLGNGRNPNYSSAVVDSTQDLDKILPDIERAYELKFR